MYGVTRQLIEKGKQEKKSRGRRCVVWLVVIGFELEDESKETVQVCKRISENTNMRGGGSVAASELPFISHFHRPRDWEERRSDPEE